MSSPLVLLAAGRGERLALGVRKARVVVDGMSLLELAWSKVAAIPGLRPIVVVVDPGDMSWAREVLKDAPEVLFAAGGERRQDSVAAGLALVPGSPDIVFVHDAARPNLTKDVVGRLLGALASPGVAGAVPVLPVDDTIRRVDATGRNLGVADRETLRLIQTPQAFKSGALRAAYERLAASGQTVSDDAAAVEAAGGCVVLVEGSRLLSKLTWPEDLPNA